jgi:magnesium transporter
MRDARVDSERVLESWWFLHNAGTRIAGRGGSPAVHRKMPFPSSFQPNRRVRVVLSSMGLMPYVSVWKAAALALAELGCAAFFIVGVVQGSVGQYAPWCVLAACGLALVVRAGDIESWATFIPGGLVGRTEQAFGPRAGRSASAVVLVERFLLAALASAVIGWYVAGVAATAIVGLRFTGRVTVEELSTQLAIGMVGLLWIRARTGIELTDDAVSRGVWSGVGIVVAATVWGVVSVARGAGAPMPPPWQLSAAPPSITAVMYLLGFAVALPALGSGGSLARIAHQLARPRLLSLRRTSSLVVVFSFVGIAIPAFLFVALVPAADQALWANTPLAGLAQHLEGPVWARAAMTFALVCAAFLVLAPAANAALLDAEQQLRKLSEQHTLPDALMRPHRRFGTMTGAIDVTAAAVVLIVLASAGQVHWLARAYAFAIAVRLCVKIAGLLRLRRLRPAAPYRAATLGLWIAGGVALLLALVLVGAGDVPSLASAALIGGLAFAFNATGRGDTVLASDAADDAFDLLSSSDVSLGQVQVRQGNVLVMVRNRRALAHVAAALHEAGDRDVVAMTARLLGVDVEDEQGSSADPTRAERELFTDVVALAERSNRTVRLLIVPTHNVFDAAVATILRLQSSEVYVGESVTLSADEQAHLLGDAWERAEKPDTLNVRLVIYHNSGRTDVYHLGAHPPSLTPGDLELIHRVWLDAVKAIGPHVHHHDVVRAALTQMEQQLNGPKRDEALGVIRQTARPADELAAVVRERDFSRLRDMVRNRPASDLAEILTALSLEDQVVVFRLLPRKDAAAVFEYLSHEQQEALLKAMAQEDVAALLNNMSPDDRTMFLEELPAAATRQLLSLLTPAERAVALTLLGYPESSIGRLMTPNYVAVREHWTIQEALDYIRTHGQNSETLNVIYLVDQQGLLIDDLGIRDLLLASPEAHISDLMDRRFVALKATEDGQAAVSVFRQHDRTALPVTDTAGMLIGIVTIDDVLDIAEATATAEIQRIGGTEALDEPYMKIALLRMVKKRAGWLTALFLGEMLTASAMGFFENEIAKAVTLALFIPLIISSGGNSGSQASTLVIRALALGEVSLRDWWRVMRREIVTGVALGVILGSVGLLRISIWSAFSTMYGAHWLLIGWTVSVSLVLVVLWGSLIGSLLPLLLRRLGFDPATSSAPFVATLVDVTGLIIYFSVASLILRGTML